MTRALKPPIILLGNTRSGTTMLQNLVSAHPELVAWYEPNAIWRHGDPWRIHDEFDESDATDDVRRYIRTRFLKYQRRHGNRRIVEKSPRNILRIPYVRSVFPDATLLYIVRNPFSFISSSEHKWQRGVTIRGIVRRLRDTPLQQLPNWARLYVVQQYRKRVLRRKYLSVWGARYRGIHEDLATGDLMTVLARQWSEGSRQAAEALRDFGGGKVLRLRYEDLVGDSVACLETICAHCGLQMTGEMARAAAESVRADRLLKWRRFDAAELARLLPEMRVEMDRHGYEVPPEIVDALAQDTGPAGIDDGCSDLLLEAS